MPPSGSLPLSPVLLAGPLLRPLPVGLLQPVVSRAMAAMYRRHRDVFRRLEEIGDAAFLIEPIDLPFRFLLCPGTTPPTLEIIDSHRTAEHACAVISGPLLRLVDLLEGRVDGDALFFSRELALGGDTGAVLALRNAVDGAGIDVVEVLAEAAGPLHGPACWFGHRARALAETAARDFERLQAAVLAPATHRLEAHDTALARLRQRIDEAPHRPARRSGGTAADVLTMEGR